MKDKNIKKEKIKILKPKNLCPSCKTREASEEYHSCPFDEEINDNYDEKCKCCDYCRNQCTQDI